jgi:RHS repeat-associated protein
MCDGSGSSSWKHDKMGRILQERRTIGAAKGEYDTDVYNLDGSEASVTDFGYGVAYTYNGAGRPLTAENAASGNNFVTAATYAPPGELAGFTNGTSISGAVTYNSRLQPIQMYFTHGTISNTTLTQLQQTTCPTTAATIMNQSYNFGFGTNDNGNVASIANCITTNRTENFTYDSLNRIASGYSSGNQWGETYTIDAWGNLTNRALVSGKSNYELLNTTAGTNNQLAGYTYDTAGNMTVNSSTTYTYDAENRLIWTNSSSGYRYVYDGDGERVEKCVAATATTACPTGAGTGTLYWRGISSDPLTETDAAGNVENTYVFFAGQRVARVDSTGAVHYYFSDHLETHAVVENATGTACEQDVDYYPYGGEQNDYCGTQVAQNYKFNGKERDAETGLDNFGARYNTSNLGRFMTPDWAAKPVNVPYANFGNPQSLNLYAYTENNPSTLGDPDGHCIGITCLLAGLDWQMNSLDGGDHPDFDLAFIGPMEKDAAIIENKQLQTQNTVQGPQQSAPAQDQQQGQGTVPPPPPTPTPPANALQKTEYGTKDEAARAAETNILDTSLQQGVEYGFRGYKNPDGTYSTTAAKTDGNPISVTLPPVSDLPPGTQNAFRGHTHPNVPGYDHEHFSPADKRNAQGEHVPSYLGTADHNFKRYTPSAPVNQRITTLGVIP